MAVLEPLLYGRKASAEMLSVSVRTIDYMTAHGELEWKKIGRRTLITATSLKKAARCNHYGPVKGPKREDVDHHQDKAA